MLTVFESVPEMLGSITTTMLVLAFTHPKKGATTLSALQALCVKAWDIMAASFWFLGRL